MCSLKNLFSLVLTYHHNFLSVNERELSNTYTTGQVAKILGEDHRNQVNRIMKYMGMNLEKINEDIT